MGRPTQQQRQKAPAPVTPEEDPLADLRESEDDTPPPLLTGGPAPEADPDAEPLVFEVRPMVTQETWDELLAEAVVALHQDLTCQGFLHGGAACGCRYIAATVLRTTVPVMTEEDMEERELEPAGE